MKISLLAMSVLMLILTMIFLFIYMFVDLPFPIPTISFVISVCFAASSVYLARLYGIRKRMDTKS